MFYAASNQVLPGTTANESRVYMFYTKAERAIASPGAVQIFAISSKIVRSLLPYGWRAISSKSWNCVYHIASTSAGPKGFDNFKKVIAEMQRG